MDLGSHNFRRPRCVLLPSLMTATLDGSPQPSLVLLSPTLLFLLLLLLLLDLPSTSSLSRRFPGWNEIGAHNQMQKENLLCSPPCGYGCTCASIQDDKGVCRCVAPPPQHNNFGRAANLPFTSPPPSLLCEPCSMYQAHKLGADSQGLPGQGLVANHPYLEAEPHAAPIWPDPHQRR
jgi:hypothetical protein